jgi:hypothetical protein
MLVRRSKGPISLILPHCIGSSWLVHRDTVHGLSSHQMRYHLIYDIQSWTWPDRDHRGLAYRQPHLQRTTQKCGSEERARETETGMVKRVLAMPGLRWLLTPDEGGSWTLD